MLFLIISCVFRLRLRAPALLACLLAGCGDQVPAPSESIVAAADDTAMEHAAKHLDPRYVCPMHPQIVKDGPGSCPICGMDLVKKSLPAPVAAGNGEEAYPRYVTAASEQYPEVRLNEAVIQRMGVRTAKVERGNLSRRIHTLGRVEYDETRIAHVHPRAEGWIEGLRLRAEGEPVSKGQELAQFYAPDILSAQVDFLLSLDPRPRGVAGVKADKARNLLRLLDVPEPIIRDIERTRETRNRVPVLAPIGGVVTRMVAREGMYVTKNSEMFTIADLGQVWVMVDVFEHQIAWIEPGLPAEIRVPAYPGKTWRGVVDYLYPDLDPKTRTLQVRLVFPNPNLQLKPNMFADVVIHGSPRTDVLKIPREALIVTGERQSVVTALGNGRFRPRDVITGIQREDEVEILSGLHEGDDIVVSGQFLIDSESSLQASFMRMSEAENGAATSSSDVKMPHER